VEITTEASLADLYRRLLKADKWSFDYETDGLHHKVLKIEGVSFMVSGEPSYVNYECFDRFTLSKFTKGVFSTDSLKIGHNLQFDLKIAKYFYGVEAPKKFDTMIAAWYLDENHPKGLKFLGPNILKLQMEDSCKAAKGKSHEDFVEYAEKDALATYLLYENFAPKLEEQGLGKLFWKMEMPYIDVLIDMTLAGINVDIAFLKEMEAYLEIEYDMTGEEVKRVLGEVNLNSPQQLCEAIYGVKYYRRKGQVIFEGLTDEKRKEIVAWTKPTDPKGTPVPATDEKALVKLVNKKKRKDLEPLLKFREADKALNTYARGYQKFVIDGMIYPLFNHVGTVTGRLSSEAPNMQNIPADTKAKYFIKDAFYAPEGYDLIVADESQLELRILAHYSQDPVLVHAFMNGLDIHTTSATGIFEKAFEDVTPTERKFAKVYNFSLIYGLSVPALAEKLGIPTKEAQQHYNRFFEMYVGIQPYMDKVCNEMRRYGYIETILGRKRRVPDILSFNYGDMKHAERQTVNSQIQGSAADILKAAQIKIYKQFRKEKIEAWMLLQIHDELVIRSKHEYSEEVAEIVKQHMQHPFTKDLSVPLITEPMICRTWGDGKRG
jgi:DNA polymerase-1